MCWDMPVYWYYSFYCVWRGDTLYWLFHYLLYSDMMLILWPPDDWYFIVHLLPIYSTIHYYYSVFVDFWWYSDTGMILMMMPLLIPLTICISIVDVDAIVICLPWYCSFVVRIYSFWWWSIYIHLFYQWPSSATIMTHLGWLLIPLLEVTIHHLFWCLRKWHALFVTVTVTREPGIDVLVDITVLQCDGATFLLLIHSVMRYDTLFGIRYSCGNIKLFSIGDILPFIPLEGIPAVWYCWWWFTFGCWCSTGDTLMPVVWCCSICCWSVLIWWLLFFCCCSTCVIYYDHYIDDACFYDGRGHCMLFTEFVTIVDVDVLWFCYDDAFISMIWLFCWHSRYCYVVVICSFGDVLWCSDLFWWKFVVILLMMHFLHHCLLMIPVDAVIRLIYWCGNRWCYWLPQYLLHFIVEWFGKWCCCDDDGIICYSILYLRYSSVFCYLLTIVDDGKWYSDIPCHDDDCSYCH